MTEYRRLHACGATWFFTVNLAQRGANRLLVENIDLLRGVFRKVRQAHPFEIDAMVVLPDHMHCIWTLPQGDSDYKTRWGLIKAGFSRGISKTERRSASRRARGERGIWQRRFWEHMIRGQHDYSRHLDYVHWNPVKHGHVKRVVDWPYSSFHACVRQGLYASDWACDPGAVIDGGE